MSRGIRPSQPPDPAAEISALRARVAELEAAFVNDLGSYLRCLYCCEKWGAGEASRHHEKCVLRTVKP